MKKQAIVKHALALAGALLFLAVGSARAQTQTNVTATITDPLGIPYSNGTYSIQLIPTGTNPSVNGQAIGGAFNGSTDANGRINVSLWPNAAISPAGTQWQFTICVSPGVQPPLGTGGQCSTPPAVVTIAGVSQDLSATLSAVAPRLTTIMIGVGSVTSVSGVSPIVATPNPINGVGTVSCPTCGTGTIGGTISATHLTDASGANTAADVLGSAVTAGTGAIGLTATAITVTPLSITGFNAAQDASLLNVGTFGNTSLECTVCGELAVFHGKGNFIDVPLVVIEGIDDSVNLLQFRNQLNEAAGGFARLRFFNSGTFEIDTVSSSGALAGAIDIGDSTATNFFTAAGPGSSGASFFLSNGRVASFTENAGPGSAAYSVGTDNSVVGTYVASNGSANAHTTFGSQATISNEVDGPTTAIPNGDLISMTTVGAVQKLTDSGIAAASVSGPTRIDAVTQSAAIGTTPILTCPASPATGTNYLFSWNAQVTTAATVSSTMGPLQLTYTTPNGGTFTAVSISYGVGPSVSALVTAANTGNSSTTPSQGLPFLLNCQAGSTISYAMGYTSSGGTAMVYDLHIRLQQQ